MSKYCFFWSGPFSQWYKAPMQINGMTFNCCEQWMMYNKAIMFGDMETANAIMANSNPREQKMLGRQVKGFNDDIWMQTAFDIVVQGNMAKFSQNPDLLAYMIETKDLEIVEASPYDTRWGIGMYETDEGIEDPANWRGENLLGKAIMVARERLLQQY